jgi:uncharacterized protein (TIGR00290 family)
MSRDRREEDISETHTAVGTGEKTPVLLSWSGGKDSSLALESLRRSTEWEPVGLLTTVTEGYERISMHGVRRALLELQAKAAGLPLTIVMIPQASSNESYAGRMGATLAGVRERGVFTVAFGDIFLADVRSYRESMLATAGMKAIFPLWQWPTAQLARDFIARGFRAVLTCVDTDQIPGGLAGREFDSDLLDDLPESADPCGENGEFHTFVYDGPIFSSPVPVTSGELVLRDSRFMYCDLV